MMMYVWQDLTMNIRIFVNDNGKSLDIAC